MGGRNLPRLPCEAYLLGKCQTAQLFGGLWAESLHRQEERWRKHGRWNHLDGHPGEAEPFEPPRDAQR
jgi:hypothetical protein